MISQLRPVTPLRRSCRAASRPRPIARAALVAWLLLLAAQTEAPAQSIEGAEIVPRGQWAVVLRGGYDVATATGLGVGVYYAPWERVQIGAELSTYFAGGAVGLATKANLFRSTDDSLLISAEAGVRAFGFLTAQGSGFTDSDVNSESSIVVEPRFAIEWRPDARHDWGLYAELGTQHHYGDYDPNAFLNGQRISGNQWRHAIRAAAGVNRRISDSWAVSLKGGVLGGNGTPIPVALVGFTKVFD